MLGGFCTLLGSRTLYPVTLVLAPWRYVISSASTQLRFRLYSHDASTNRKGRSSSGRNLSPSGPPEPGEALPRVRPQDRTRQPRITTNPEPPDSR